MLRTTLIALTLLTTGLSAQTPLGSEELASGFDKPVWAGSPPGDPRVFVVEQHTGLVRLIDAGGNVLATPFLDLGGAIDSLAFERGLLGLAFDPDFASNGHVYVDYTRTDGAIMVQRYTVSAGDPDVADPASALTLLGPIAHSAPNHNGGMLAFGPDGHLYVSLGDNDSPPCNAQNGANLFGALLRLDVSAGGAPPADNPFVGDPAFDDRLWAIGLRNPWRFCFDPANGDLYIGDVGEGAREEIHWTPGTSAGGENYGWPVMEGSLCTGSTCFVVPTPPCNDPSLSLPVAEYDHALGCSVTGGVVYRGCALPDLRGTYFYADWCTSTIWSLVMDGGVATQQQDRTAEIAAGLWNIASFGVDGDGEVLIVGQGSGSIWRIVPDAPAERWSDEGCALAGVAGEPVLTGSGPLTAGSANQVDLGGAAPSATAGLFVALSSSPVGFKGGTLKPFPFFPPVFLSTAPDGSLSLPFVMPAGAPGCTELWAQIGIADAAAPAGVALSNAVLGITP